MPDARKNFAVSTIAAAPAPPLTGTSLTVKGGQGKRFPVPPFNATVAPEKETATEDNAEIVRVTAVVGDTFTIVRAQEGTIAKEIAFGFRIYSGQSDKVLKDIEAGVAGPPGPPGNELALGIARTTNHTLQLTDAGKSQDCNSASLIEISIPLFATVAMPEGSVFEVTKIGSGPVTVVPIAGVTVLPAAASYKLRVTGSVVGLRKRDGGNNWIVSGDYE